MGFRNNLLLHDGTLTQRLATISNLTTPCPGFEPRSSRWKPHRPIYEWKPSNFQFQPFVFCSDLEAHCATFSVLCRRVTKPRAYTKKVLKHHLYEHPGRIQSKFWNTTCTNTQGVSKASFETLHVRTPRAYTKQVLKHYLYEHPGRIQSHFSNTTCTNTQGVYKASFETLHVRTPRAYTKQVLKHYMYEHPGRIQSKFWNTTCTNTQGVYKASFETLHVRTPRAYTKHALKHQNVRIPGVMLCWGLCMNVGNM